MHLIIMKQEKHGMPGALTGRYDRRGASQSRGLGGFRLATAQERVMRSASPEGHGAALQVAMGARFAWQGEGQH